MRMHAGRFVGMSIVSALVILVAAAPASADSGPITANGPSVVATVSSAGVPAVFTFTGKAGEVVTATTTSGTFGGNCDASLLLTGQVGGAIATASCVGQSGFMGEVVLPGATTYKLQLVPSGSSTGSVTLSLSANPADSTITANGAAVTFTSSHTGQGGDYTFSGTAGEVVTLSASGGTFPSACDLSVQLVSPYGTQLGSQSCASQSTFIGETMLPGTGTYVVDLVPAANDLGKNVGHVTLSLSANPADSTITANGAPVTFTATHTAQGRDYTFAGTAGEVVTVSASSGTFPGSCDLTVQLIGPYGTLLGPNNCASQTGFIGETVLPGTGTYTVDVAPTGSDPGKNVGHVTLWLSANPANSTITANGAAVTFTASHTAQGRDYTFSGTAGEVVTVSTNGGTFPGGCDLDMQILTSSGSSIGSFGCASQSGFIGETALPGAGTYTVDVTPTASDLGKNVGHVTLALSANPADSTITANGPAATFTASHTGQGGDYKFSGTAGEVVTISTSGGTFPGGCDLTVQLLTSSGGMLGNSGCASQSGFIGETTLPGTGTYLVDVVPTGSDPGVSVGHLTVWLSANPANTSITPSGAAVKFTASHTGQGRDYTFSGTAGEALTFTNTGGTFPSSCDVSLDLLSAVGGDLANFGCIGQGTSARDSVLPATGAYIVDVVPSSDNPGTNVGSVTLGLKIRPASRAPSRPSARSRRA